MTTPPELPQAWLVAECLLPDLTVRGAQEMGRRITAALDRPTRPPVRFLGALLMPGDEVLLCVFAGPEGAVRTVSEQARLPFERLVACLALDWART